MWSSLFIAYGITKWNDILSKIQYKEICYIYDFITRYVYIYVNRSHDFEYRFKSIRTFEIQDL